VKHDKRCGITPIRAALLPGDAMLRLRRMILREMLREEARRSAAKVRHMNNRAVMPAAQLDRLRVAHLPPQLPTLPRVHDFVESGNHE
jgi:hypothetical protein